MPKLSRSFVVFFSFPIFLTDLGLTGVHAFAAPAPERVIARRELAVPRDVRTGVEHFERARELFQLPWPNGKEKRYLEKLRELMVDLGQLNVEYKKEELDKPYGILVDKLLDKKNPIHPALLSGIFPTRRTLMPGSELSRKLILLSARIYAEANRARGDGYYLVDSLTHVLALIDREIYFHSQKADSVAIARLRNVKLDIIRHVSAKMAARDQ